MTLSQRFLRWLVVHLALATTTKRTTTVIGAFVPTTDNYETTHTNPSEPPPSQSLTDDKNNNNNKEKQEQVLIHKRWTEHDRLERDLSLVRPRQDDDKNTNLQKLFSDDLDATQAAQVATQLLLDQSSVTQRLESLFAKATTASCRAKILQHYGYFVTALGREEPLPFASSSRSFARLNNTCPEPVYDDWTKLPPGMHLGHIQNRSYEPPRDQAIYVDDPRDLKLLYLILTHDDAPSTIRLVQALQDDDGDDNNNNTTMVHFVIHVDAKEASQDTYLALQDFSVHYDNVHVLPHPYRVSVNWGGFTMVNATLQMLKYATGMLPTTRAALPFDKAIHLSSTTYPLASNTEIRYELAKYPVDANFMNVIMKPQRSNTWNYFVECDDQLHRIYHLPVPTRATHGFDLFETSQWWIISRDFAQYLTAAEPGSIVQQVLPYMEHVVVADENFFGTVLRQTEYCLTHVNRNYLHMDFDRWESEIPSGQRDPRKCMMKDPNHCGRSPTTLTLQDAPILELSDNLFARKVVGDSEIKDLIDQWRKQREIDIRKYLKDPENSPKLRSQSNVEFEGHGVLLVAKHTVLPVPDEDTNTTSTTYKNNPLCLGLGDSGNVVRLVPCFNDWVPVNLLPQWQTGAVLEMEVRPHNRWEFAPCTSSPRMERNPLTGGMTFYSDSNRSTTGEKVPGGPLCMLKQIDGVRSGRCFDGETGGGERETHVFPCIRNTWGQLLSVGNGQGAPQDSLFFHVPQQRQAYMEEHGGVYHPTMCLGVRSVAHEDDENHELQRIMRNSSVSNTANDDHKNNIVAIPCSSSNSDAAVVLEFYFVPFIVEEENALTEDEETEMDEYGDEDETCTAKSVALNDIAFRSKTAATTRE
ncbi:hypothetical protein ACA910_021341 [Epithemia clementina (nom. ined.)]